MLSSIGFYSHPKIHSLRLFTLLFIRQIRPLILALDLFHNCLHLLGLPGPLVLAHLGLLLEQRLIRLPIAATQAIPQRRELAVIVVEVQMMHRVARGAINNRRIRDILAVVDEDGPDVDPDEQQDVRELL